jgi:hypothetical protein
MRATLRIALGAPVLAAVAAVTVASQSAWAAPVNAPNGSTGTASCSNGKTYTFIVNGTPENAQGTAWSPAFLTDTAGGRALFHPVSLSLTFSGPGLPAPMTFSASKPTAPGPISCQVTGHPNGFPQGTFTGTVTGTITELG